MTPMPIRKVVRDGLRKAVLWALETDPGRSLPPASRHYNEITPQGRSTGIKARNQRIRTRRVDGMEIPNLKGTETTRLVLQTLLDLHDSIVDADAWQGYEGTPDQVEKLMWEIYGVLTKNPHINTSEEAIEEWMEDYATTRV